MLCSAARMVLPFSLPESPEDLVDLDLVADVEMGARLVEEEEGRVLGQGPGDEDPLSFAAAEVGHLLVLEMGRLGHPEDLSRTAASAAEAPPRRPWWM